MYIYIYICIVIVALCSVYLLFTCNISGFDQHSIGDAL